jgi:hypothetical protein
MREDGNRLRDIAAEFGISESAASRICSGNTYGPLPHGQASFHWGRRLTRQEGARLVARRKAGETFPSLSRDFGISLSTAYRVVRGEYRGWAP